MHPLMVERIVFPLHQTKNRQRVLHYLRDLEETQWYSRAELQQLQWEKLKRLLKHCYENVPYYRELFTRFSLKPQNIMSPEDLLKIPVLTKSELKRSYHSLQAQDKKRPFGVNRTSGSTGIPVIVHVDKEAADCHYAAKLRGRSWWGLRIGDRNGLLWGRDEEPGLKVAIRNYVVENQIFLSLFDLTEDSALGYFRKLERFKPKFLYGYASALQLLAQLFRDKGLDATALGINVIISTAEILHKHRRRMIELTFGCPVVNEFGCAETQVISFQCPHGNMHVTAENLYVEFVDGAKPVAPGERGHVVATDLNNYAMPLIRYMGGDMGSPLENGCSCGRGLPLMDSIVGRDVDMVMLESGELLHPEIFTLPHSCPFFGAVKQLKVVQKSYSDFLVEAVVEKSARHGFANYFSNVVQNELGTDVNLDFEFIDSIPREESGKLRYFVSEIGRLEDKNGKVSGQGMVGSR